MRLTVITGITATPAAIWPMFNRDLFERLAPPFPLVHVLRFDGCRAGDVVEVELNFLLFRQRWVSEITTQCSTEGEISFVDEGRRLPFFLRQWRHHHRLIAVASGTQLIDDIEYHSGWHLLDLLLYPSIWMQMAYRRPIYRRAFNAECLRP